MLKKEQECPRVFHNILGFFCILYSFSFLFLLPIPTFLRTFAPVFRPLTMMHTEVGVAVGLDTTSCKDMTDIPQGSTKEDIKIREKIIKDFYANWIAENPTKQVMNICLGKSINVKFLSINETYEKASRSYESTVAVFRLTEILQNAVLIDELPAKRNTRNQKQFEKLLVMQYENIKLTVGLQRSNQDLVQYCITVPQQMPQTKDKATDSK